MQSRGNTQVKSISQITDFINTNHQTHAQSQQNRPRSSPLPELYYDADAFLDLLVLGGGGPLSSVAPLDAPDPPPADPPVEAPEES